MGMFHCRGLSRKISTGRWSSLPSDSPTLKRISRGFKLGVIKAISKMSVVPWRASKWVCSSLFRYVSFSSFTVPLKLRPDVVVVAQLKTLCFELKSPSRITLFESEITALNRSLSGFPSGQQMVTKVSVVLLESSSSIAKVLLLVMILKSLLSYTLFRISSDLYKKATSPFVLQVLSFLLIS